MSGTTLYRTYELPCGCKCQIACMIVGELSPDDQPEIDAVFQEQLAKFKADHGIHPEMMAEEVVG